MHRQPLLDILDAYLARHADEAQVVETVRSLVSTQPQCLERTCLPGHITGSAWIISADRASVLLTHHRKLDRWLQVGGHADGDNDVRRVALREAEEESGLTRFEPLDGLDPSLPFDIDVHAIPARGDEAAHWHHDLRYLLIAAPGQSLHISDESHDLRWIPRQRLADLSSDESVLRLERKACALLGEPPPA